MEISARLKEEFNNGKIYYEMNGRKLLTLPGTIRDMPSKEFLQWHNDNIYRAS